MNKRIEELLGQAYDGAVPETWTTLSSEQLGRIYEKFAELIVRECLDILDDEDTGDVYGKSVRLAMTRIKQHFGVEE